MLRSHEWWRSAHSCQRWKGPSPSRRRRCSDRFAYSKLLQTDVWRTSRGLDERKAGQNLETICRKNRQPWNHRLHQLSVACRMSGGARKKARRQAVPNFSHKFEARISKLGDLPQSWNAYPCIVLLHVGLNQTPSMSGWSPDVSEWHYSRSGYSFLLFDHFIHGEPNDNPIIIKVVKHFNVLNLPVDKWTQHQSEMLVVLNFQLPKM